VSQAAAFEHFLSDIGLQPMPAWIAILGLVILQHCAFWWVLAVSRLAFPIGSFGVGTFLYLRYPVLYIGFTWWLFLNTVPPPNRLSKWLDEYGLILLSPFPTLITIATFYDTFLELTARMALPLCPSLYRCIL